MTKLYHVKLSTGDTAVILGQVVLLAADPGFDNTAAPLQVAKAIENATGFTVDHVEMPPPPLEDWNWDDIVKILHAEVISAPLRMTVVGRVWETEEVEFIQVIARDPADAERQFVERVAVDMGLSVGALRKKGFDIYRILDGWPNEVGAKEPVDGEPELWADNSIQFPRLLSEIMATQDGLDMEALAESMDLSVAEVGELFDRANDAWEAAKALRMNKPTGG